MPLCSERQIDVVLYKDVHISYSHTVTSLPSSPYTTSSNQENLARIFICNSVVVHETNLFVPSFLYAHRATADEKRVENQSYCNLFVYENYLNSFILRSLWNI